MSKLHGQKLRLILPSEQALQILVQDKILTKLGPLVAFILTKMIILQAAMVMEVIWAVRLALAATITTCSPPQVDSSCPSVHLLVMGWTMLQVLEIGKSNL